MTWLRMDDSGALLCRHCDVYVGYAGAGVASAPEGRDRAWLAAHCWVCHRHADEVRADPYGRHAGDRRVAT